MVEGFPVRPLGGALRGPFGVNLVHLPIELGSGLVEWSENDQVFIYVFNFLFIYFNVFTFFTFVYPSRMFFGIAHLSASIQLPIELGFFLD
jgi:hypothetical protein